MRTVKTLIRLGRCPGWSESSLGTHAILSGGGSYHLRAYHSDPVVLDRHGWTNSVDPHQIAPEGAVWSGSALFHAVWIIWATLWQNQQNDCAPSEDSDQPGPPPSLIRVFADCMKKAWVLSYPLSRQQRLWPHWVDAQSDLSIRWALHSHFVGFVMRWLILRHYCMVTPHC